MECQEDRGRTLTRPPISVVSINSSEYQDNLLFIWNMSHYAACLLSFWPKFEFRKGFVKVFAAFELPLDSHFNLRLFGFKAFPLHPYLLSLKVSNFLRCKKTHPSNQSSPSFDHAAVFVWSAFLILKRFCFGESRFSHQAPRRDGGIKKCLSQLAARGRGWWEWALQL